MLRKDEIHFVTIFCDLSACSSLRHHPCGSVRPRPRVPGSPHENRPGWCWSLGKRFRTPNAAVAIPAWYIADARTREVSSSRILIVSLPALPKLKRWIAESPGRPRRPRALLSGTTTRRSSPVRSPIQPRYGEDSYAIGRFVLDRAKTLGLSRTDVVRRFDEPDSLFFRR
jgi:hypothetical protein